MRKFCLMMPVVGMRLALALAFTAILATTALAKAPAIKVTGMAPVVGGRVVFEPKAPRTPSAPPTALLNMDVFLKNDGAESVKLVKIVYQFTYGNGQPEGALLQPVQYLLIEKALSGEEAPFIPVGKTRKVMLPSFQHHRYPLPTAIRMELHFDKFDEPIIVRAGLGGDYQNVTPAGNYLFPAPPADLKEGERWYQSGGSDHQFGTAHRTSSSQRHGYDLGVARWDETKKQWIRFEGDGKENKDYLIYGKRVRAAAGGRVVFCFRSAEENPKPGEKHPDRELWDEKTLKGIPAGGNGMWIDHGNGEYALYAHMQKDSIPLSVCPKNGPQGVNAPVVKAGDFIGLAGNSGDSSNPHLHFHVQFGPRGVGEGVPVRFRNVQVSTNTESPNVGWLEVDNRSLPTGPVYILPLPPPPLTGDKKTVATEPKRGGYPIPRPAPARGRP